MNLKLSLLLGIALLLLTGCCYFCPQPGKLSWVPSWHWEVKPDPCYPIPDCTPRERSAQPPCGQ